MPQLRQSSFAKGAVTPSIYGRVDTAAYQVAVKKAENCIVRPYGGLSNRPGLKFIGPCKDHTYAPRIIPFQFKATDQYILEFGNLYMRVVRNDAYVTETALTGCTATAADPVVVTKASHGYSNGDDVFISGMTEMVELNGGFYAVANVTTNTFQLVSTYDGTDIDGSGWTAETTGGDVAKLYELTTTYAQADLDQIKFTQSADVMTLTHPSYPARDVSRTDHNVWTISDVSFVPLQDHPTGNQVQVNSTGSETRTYGVTAIKAESFEESLTAIDNTGFTITGATNANPCVITATAHGFDDGDEVEINGIVGMTDLNGRRFVVANSLTNTFELLNTDTTDWDSYTSGGEAHGTAITVTNSNVTENNTVSWTAVAGAGSYYIYRKDNGIWGLIGESTSTEFTDKNVGPDSSVTPPIYRDPFSLEDEYPGTTSYYEQRQVYGGSTSLPDTIHYSRTADRNNFAAASPATASDSFDTSLASRQVNQVRHLVPLNDLVVLTSGSEWVVNSGPDTAFELATVRQKPQSTWGCSHLRPYTVGTTVFYVEENESNVRTLGYSFQKDGYTGTKLNLLAEHLLRNKTISDWSVANSPETRFYFCRNDGAGLTMTYDEEQEVIAWTSWNTDGSFEKTSSLRHADGEVFDQVYFVVKREVNGNTVRYLEKQVGELTSGDPADAFYVDSGLSYDLPITITSVTSANPVVITAASHGFSDGDEVDITDILWEPTIDSLRTKLQPTDQAKGRYIIGEVTTNTFEIATTSGKDLASVTQANPGVVTTIQNHNLSDGDEVHFHNVGGMTELNGNGYTVTVTGDKTFSIGVNSSAYTTFTAGGRMYKATDGSDWNAYKSGGEVRKAITTIRGLQHLEGESLVGVLDGSVYRDIEVSEGAATLPDARSFARVHLGLPYEAEIETLDIDRADEPIQGVPIHVPRVTVRFEESRGLVIGPASPRVRDSAPDLIEVKQRQYEKYGEPTQLLTGTQEVTLRSRWNSTGSILLRQKDPMPMNILSIIPFVEIGDIKDVSFS